MIHGHVAIVGAGEIGSGWAALYAAFGAEVRIFDPDPGAEKRARAALAEAWRIGVGATPHGAIAQFSNLDDVVRGARWVQESVPERRDLKRAVLDTVGRSLAREAILASSTSTFTASELSRGAPWAERFLIAHPLHPVYAVPVVELCAGAATVPATLAQAEAVMRGVRREPVFVRAEIAGLVSCRLTAAILREALDLVARGAVSAADVERIVSHGIALGWVAAGVLGTEVLGAGGDTAAFVERSGGPLACLLDAERRAALVAKAHEIEVDKSAWAEALVRIARAARERGA
jgi:carnitine 3-dehydrogenase